MATIDSLEIKVVADADAAIAALGRLTSAFTAAGGAARGAASGAAAATAGATAVADSTVRASGGVSRATVSLGSFWGALRRVRSGISSAVSGIRGIGHAASAAGTSARRGAGGVMGFFQALRRVAYMRSLRAIVRSIAGAFKEGAQNLYQWSKATGNGDFAKNMDRIATSVKYLKNALGAMLEPLVRILAPIIEWVIDKLVWLTEKVSQFFAALTGADTYTAAKKVAATWGEAASDVASSAGQAAADVKRTLLGFDEINKLEKRDKSSGGSGGGSPATSGAVEDMFEERPLEPWAQAISDFMNKLKGWIDTVGEWFEALFSPFRRFFADAENALNSLGGTLNNMPDKDIRINLVKGDWNLMNELNGISTGIDITVSVNGVDWDDTAWLGANMTSYVATRRINVEVAKSNWDDTAWMAASMTPYTATRTIKTSVQKGSWDDTAWLGANMTSYTAIRTIKVETDMSLLDVLKNLLAIATQLTNFRLPDWLDAVILFARNPNKEISLTVSVKKGEWDNTAWLGASMTPYTATRTIKTKVEKGDWDPRAWTAANMTSYTATRTVKSVVKQGDWDSRAWMAANMTPYTATRTVKAVIKKGDWDSRAWMAANMTPYTATRTVKAVVKKGDWDSRAWNAANMTSYTATRTVKSVVKKGDWDSRAWMAANMTPYTATRTVKSVVKKGDWDSSAWSAANMTSYTATRTVKSAVKKGDWDGSAWSAANMTSYTATRTVKSVVKQGDWNGSAWSAANMTSYNATRTIKSVVKKGDWDSTAWTAATMTNYTVTRTVNVVLKKDGWTTVDQYVNDNFGGATGGGGQTAGGGGGRYDHTPISVGVAVNAVAGDGMSPANLGYGTGLVPNVYDPGSYDTVYLQQGWNGTPAQALQLDDLSTTMKVGLEIDKNANKVNLTFGGGGTGKGINVNMTTASGGVFSNGFWKSIPQYAGGTASAHGSLFLAGEAGPEIVGHVGGRTEVLNRSQLAATMYSAVQAAMAPAAANFAYAAQSMGGSDGVDMEALADMIQRGVEQALNRSTEYERQQVDLLRSINEKDSTVEISTGSINRAQQRMNRRSGLTIVPVGT